MQIMINKLGVGIFLLGLLTSACIKTGDPLPLLETRPVGGISEKNPGKGSQKGSEKKHKSEASLPQKDLRDRERETMVLQFQKAIRFLKQGQLAKARSLLETLRDDHPGLSVFHNNMGIVYRRLGLYDEAIHAYKQAISISNKNPDGADPEVYYNLAIALRGQGAFKKAEGAYQQAIALAPDFEDAHFNLAVLYDLYLNDPGKALYHYQQQIKLSGGADQEIGIWMAALKKRLGGAGSQ